MSILKWCGVCGIRRGKHATKKSRNIIINSPGFSESNPDTIFCGWGKFIHHTDTQYNKLILNDLLPAHLNLFKYSREHR